MTNEEIIQHIRAGGKTPALMEQLYNQNKPIIYKMAKPYAEKAEINDLMQEAYIILCAAVEDYDESGEIKFITYLTKCLKREFYKYINIRTGSGSLPQNKIEEIGRYYKTLNHYRAQHSGADPSREEMRKLLNLTPKQFDNLLFAINCNNTIDLYAPAPGTDDFTMADTLPAPDCTEDEAEENAAREAAAANLWEAVDKLPQSAGVVIKEYYKGNKPFNAIAENMGISMQAAQQRKNRGLELLAKQQKVKEAAKVYNCFPSIAYKGVFSFFKNHGSVTEYMALKQIEAEEMEKYLKGLGL